MRKITIAILLAVPFLFAKCKKTESTKKDCIIPDLVPMQPYSFPVWHPNGQLLGFNYTPLAGIGSNGNAPCIWYSYSGKPDSTGFYIMNKDRTGFKRITNYSLLAPAWSPDGNWLAFNIGGSIFKMRYTANSFDTANIIRLTEFNDGACFFPSWTSNGDSIFFDSNKGSSGQGYYVWKMASDGTGKTGFVNTGRQPFVSDNGKVYFVRGFSGQPEIFSMNTDGTSQTQITLNGKCGTRNTPKYFNGNLYYYDCGSLYRINSNGITLQLTSPCQTYAVSSIGEIVYSKMDFGLGYDKQKGTLWIMNADGTNNRQLTFNNNF